MATHRNLLVQFTDLFVLNAVDVPDSAHSAALVKDLINNKLATKGYTLGGREIVGVIMIPAGPVHYFHSEVYDAHTARPTYVKAVDESGAIGSAEVFNGHDCVSWWKNTYIYTGSGDTGYGAGGLTTVQFLLQTTGCEE